MISYENITLIGTSHISPESVKEVKEAIQEINPDLVALELDRRRFEALLSKKRKTSWREIKQFGIKGFLFNMVGSYFESALGKRTGSMPGSEMKTAIFEAKKIGAKIALIDQDVIITLKKLSKVPFKEKFFIVFDSIFKPESYKNVKLDLKKVPDKKIVEKMINDFKRYPNLYRVLIEERNKHMAKNLYKLKSEYNKVVGVIGAGHEEEIIKEIKNADKQKRD